MGLTAKKRQLHLRFKTCSSLPSLPLPSRAPASWRRFTGVLLGFICVLAWPSVPRQKKGGGSVFLHVKRWVVLWGSLLEHDLVTSPLRPLCKMSLAYFFFFFFGNLANRKLWAALVLGDVDTTFTLISNFRVWGHGTGSHGFSFKSVHV